MGLNYSYKYYDEFATAILFSEKQLAYITPSLPYLDEVFSNPPEQMLVCSHLPSFTNKLHIVEKNLIQLGRLVHLITTTVSGWL